MLVVDPRFWEGVRSALGDGDVSLAWSVWSFSVEVFVVHAFVTAGGPLPASGALFGRSSAQFKKVAVGDPVVGRHRAEHCWSS